MDEARNTLGISSCQTVLSETYAGFVNKSYMTHCRQVRGSYTDAATSVTKGHDEYGLHRNWFEESTSDDYDSV